MSPIVTACPLPPCLAHHNFSHSSSLRPQFLGSFRWIHAPLSSLAGLLTRCAQTFPPAASVFLPRRDSYASLRPLMSGGGNASRSMRSRIAANNFRVTATSASWHVTYFACRVTFDRHRAGGLQGRETILPRLSRPQWRRHVTSPPKIGPGRV